MFSRIVPIDYDAVALHISKRYFDDVPIDTIEFETLRGILSAQIESLAATLDGEDQFEEDTELTEILFKLPFIGSVKQISVGTSPGIVVRCRGACVKLPLIFIELA